MIHQVVAVRLRGWTEGWTHGTMRCSVPFKGCDASANPWRSCMTRSVNRTTLDKCLHMKFASPLTNRCDRRYLILCPSEHYKSHLGHLKPNLVCQHASAAPAGV